MCKVAAFYEGGISYTELSNMPLDEFFAVIDNANQINTDRKTEMKKAKNG